MCGVSGTVRSAQRRPESSLFATRTRGAEAAAAACRCRADWPQARPEVASTMSAGGAGGELQCAEVGEEAEDEKAGTHHGGGADGADGTAGKGTREFEGLRGVDLKWRVGMVRLRWISGGGMQAQR